MVTRLLCACLILACWTEAQTNTSGSVDVSVTDASGAIVPGADLGLRNLETNDTRKASTQTNGVYQFQALPFGRYRLTASKPGFDNAVFDPVEVQTGRVTAIRATLTVGHSTQTVQVNDASPLVEPTSSTLSTTIDTKQMTNLPVVGRNVMSLAFLVPGWSSTGAGSTSGTWNNMPGGAVVGADFDGTPGISNRFRSGGFNYGTTSTTPRIEDVGEMTISTGQLDLGGTGTSAMRISIVSRHGTNEFHGRFFEDFRNTALNANSWLNNARSLPRNILKLNDFGVGVGGPVIKNKLFFFGTWAQSIQPVTNSANAVVLSAAAQQGNFAYRNSAGTLQTANVFQIAGKAGYRPTALPEISSQLQKLNGVLNQGSLTPTSDPNLNTLSFLVPAQTNTYFPDLRVDYNAKATCVFMYRTRSEKPISIRRTRRISLAASTRPTTRQTAITTGLRVWGSIGPCAQH
jgi:hypothetical protein